MEVVFLKILNMGIAASWLIAAVMVLRLLLKKAPRWITCILWAFVAVRLVCPFSFETVFSLIPSTETVSPDIAYSDSPAIDSGVNFIDNAINPMIGETFAPKPEESANPLQIWLFVASVVWIGGMLVLISYAIISCWRLRRRVRAAVPLRDNIWICDDIKTPFILGVVRPRIYLPSDTDKAEESYILAHELAHLRRHDNCWKPLGFALLAVYWFHPLVWAAYILLCRDIELACDEKVIRNFGIEDKKAYSQALLSCSVSRGAVMACPLQFGEVGVKERVKSVLNYKKPGFWIILTAILVCGVVAVCFLTNPRASEEEVVSRQISVYGVVRELETEPGRLVLEIPYAGTVEIPDAKEIYPYYEPGEEGFAGLTAGQLVQIIFPVNTEVYVMETYPARYSVAAEEIVAMSSGGFYLLKDGDQCLLGFPRGRLSDSTDLLAGDTLNIYLHTENTDEESQEGNRIPLLASATVLSLGEESDIPMIYVKLSAENARRFLEAWGSSLGMTLEYESENDTVGGVSEVGTAESGESRDGGQFLGSDGEFHGYVTELVENRVSVDVQLWITPDDEEWKSEYDDAAGFAVVDAGNENMEYLLDESCVYSVLENHWQPRIELTGEEFAEYVKENTDFPVLWIFTLKNGKVIRIEEQYRP